ncbi:hypothetical protein NIES4075_37470 [Tolypothrix sp. NIES-4075]|uniref:ribbon-helix-helix protein, CopG family n=1 Tax=Tolypothrix sp. NIES-4075 TaxID=2005459 RepID=UPI000B5C9E52|nr:ribbon-helix-helix protein, CopG family [Tolypothrix sp. NIES-4075]GAX42743.1 hypothetical protein NIES4075_37470 [Tolypothrix sp. NIES-4075]
MHWAPLSSEFIGAMPLNSEFLKWLNTLPTKNNDSIVVAHIAIQMKEKHLSIRVPGDEMKILEKYAKKTKRTKTDLVREWIRSLEKMSDCTTGHR